MRREKKRIPAAFMAGDVRGKGFVSRLSSTGLFFACDDLPAPGCAARVVFHDNDGSEITVEGIVRWNTAQLPPKASGFGISIDEPPSEFLEFYELLLLT